MQIQLHPVSLLAGVGVAALGFLAMSQSPASNGSEVPKEIRSECFTLMDGDRDVARLWMVDEGRDNRGPGLTLFDKRGQPVVELALREAGDVPELTFTVRVRSSQAGRSPARGEG